MQQQEHLFREELHQTAHFLWYRIKQERHFCMMLLFVYFPILSVFYNLRPRSVNQCDHVTLQVVKIPVRRAVEDHDRRPVLRVVIEVKHIIPLCHWGRFYLTNACRSMTRSASLHSLMTVQQNEKYLSNRTVPVDNTIVQ